MYNTYTKLYTYPCIYIYMYVCQVYQKTLSGFLLGSNVSFGNISFTFLLHVFRVSTHTQQRFFMASSVSFMFVLIASVTNCSYFFIIWSAVQKLMASWTIYWSRLLIRGKSFSRVRHIVQECRTNWSPNLHISRFLL